MPFIVTLMVSPSVPVLLSGCGAWVGASVGVGSLLASDAGASVGSGVGASVGAGVAVTLIWSTVTVCSGSVPSAPLFRSVSTAFVEPATSVRPLSILSVLASRLSVMFCNSSARWARSAASVVSSRAVPLLLRAAWVAALCWA